jgi:transcription initiation factor TFIID subunit 11
MAKRARAGSAREGKRYRAGSSRAPSRIASDADTDSDEGSSDEEMRKWKESQVRLRDYYDQMSDEQVRRYEQFRRSCFDIDAVRSLMDRSLKNIGRVSKKRVNRRMGIVVSGSAKVLVGEIIEEARTVMEERSESGAILPQHVREAVRRLENRGKLPFSKIRGSVLR